MASVNITFLSFLCFIFYETQSAFYSLTKILCFQFFKTQTVQKSPKKVKKLPGIPEKKHCKYFDKCCIDIPNFLKVFIKFLEKNQCLLPYLQTYIITKSMLQNNRSPAVIQEHRNIPWERREARSFLDLRSVPP